MLTISLEEMRFHASHGVYPEESVVGNIFLVTVRVEIGEEPPPADLSDTIDYERLYAVVREQMEAPASLLETIAYRCVYHIRQAFPHALAVEISIGKLHPPMGGETARSVVTLRKTF
jgi:dihydroneopterin aldolase